MQDTLSNQTRAIFIIPPLALFSLPSPYTSHSASHHYRKIPKFPESMRYISQARTLGKRRFSIEVQLLKVLLLTYLYHSMERSMCVRDARGVDKRDKRNK